MKGLYDIIVEGTPIKAEDHYIWSFKDTTINQEGITYKGKNYWGKEAYRKALTLDPLEGKEKEEWKDAVIDELVIDEIEYALNWPDKMIYIIDTNISTVTSVRNTRTGYIVYTRLCDIQFYTSEPGYISFEVL